MERAQILGVASAIPEQVVSTQSLLEEAKTELYGVPADVIETEAGISELRQAVPGTRHCELASKAGYKAMLDCNMGPSDIDTVLYCGSDRDLMEPSTAHLIADILDIRANLCFDIANACHGFTAGIITANSLIASGQSTNVLVVSAELNSRHIGQFVEMLKKGKAADDISNIIGVFTLGDGAGAMIFGPSNSESGFLASHNRTDAKHHPLCHFKSVNDAGMEMAKIVAATLKLGKDMRCQTYKMLDWSPEDVDILILHQVSRKAHQKTLALAGAVNARSIETVGEYGNLASATIPVVYDLMKRQGMIIKNNKVLVASSGSGISVSHLGFIV